MLTTQTTSKQTTEQKTFSNPHSRGASNRGAIYKIVPGFWSALLLDTVQDDPAETVPDIIKDPSPKILLK